MKKLDGICRRMLRAILNKYWKQHPTRQQLYARLPPISRTIQIKRTRFVGHSWRSKDKLISNVLLWTSSHGQAGTGRPTRTYLPQLYTDTGFSQEYLQEGIDDRDEWCVCVCVCMRERERERERERRVREIRASGMTWWWWELWRSFARSIKETNSHVSAL